jgi:hypothetical protein
MSYRDDKETMRQRIETLEGELSSAQETIARLKGEVDERASAEVGDMLTKEQLHVSRELDLVLSEAGVEAIAEMLRRRLPKCQVAEIGRTLSCQWGTAELRVVRHDDRTEIKLSANDPRSKPTLAVGGFGFAVLGGPLIAGPLIALAGAWMAVPVIPLLLIAGYLLMDKLTTANLRRARTTLRGALEATVELAQEHALRPPARIEVPAAVADAEAEAEEIAEADRETQADAEEIAEAEMEAMATAEAEEIL